MNGFVLVALGGGLGAAARYGAGILATRIFGVAFPVGTMIVNIAGSFLMGLLIGLLARYVPENSTAIRLFVGIGVLGGFTTFSSFSLDAITLFERGALMEFSFYVLGSVVVSLLALVLGLSLMRGFA